jgi:hypothetical protein
LAACAAGLRARAAQKHHWSRRVRRRLVVGLATACCTGLAVTANMLERHKANAAAPAERVLAAALATESEDDSLVKPGWYGEVHANGVLVVITSFEERASESRRFNRGLKKPVTFATLSVINTGSPLPVSLATPQVTLRLKSGGGVPSLGLQELFSRGIGQDEALSRRLSGKLTAQLGEMLPDIPVCLDPPFDWREVGAVEVSVGAQTLTVPGRFMSAQEKEAALRTVPPKAPQKADPRRAEVWYQNL